MSFPFDVSHLAVRRYHHLGEGIDFGEVIRMKSELTTAMRAILDKPEKDSPVYTFFADLQPPVRKKIEEAVAQSSPGALRAAPAPPNPALFDVPAGAAPPAPEPPRPTMSVLMDEAHAAFAKNDFSRAKTLLNQVSEMAPRDSYVVQQLALATYKSESPDPLRALHDAAQILTVLDPVESNDPETLGLWGSIHARIWDLTKDRTNLDSAVAAREKGFYLKNDYSNGINLSFLYDVRASVSDEPDATADITMARRIRQRVLSICESLLAHERADLTPQMRYWILVTMAEAHLGLGDESNAKQYLKDAAGFHPLDWMSQTTEARLRALAELMKTRKR